MSRRPRMLATAAFVVVCVGIGAWIAGRDWSRVTAAAAQLGAPQIALSFGIGLLAMAAMLVSWIYSVRACGIDISIREGWTIYSLAQLTKYVPGGVWPILTQTALGRGIGASPSAMSSAGAVHLALTVGLALLVGAVTSPFVLTSMGWIRWAPVLALAFLMALWPPVLNRLLTLVSRTLRRVGLSTQVPTVSSRQLTCSAMWCLVANVLFALHIVCLLPRPGLESVDHVLPALAAYALASAAGVLLVLAPAGAGAREGVLILVLSSQYSLAVALVVAVVSRAVLIAVDVLMGLAQSPTLIDLALRRGATTR